MFSKVYALLVIFGSLTAMNLQAQITDTVEVKTNPFYNESWIRSNKIASIAISHRNSESIFKYDSLGRLIYKRIDFLIQDSLFYKENKLIKIKSDNYDNFQEEEYVYDSIDRLVKIKETSISKKTNRTRLLTAEIKYNFKGQVSEIRHLDHSITSFEYLKDTVVATNRANFFGIKATTIHKTIYQDGLLKTVLNKLQGEEIKLAYQISYDHLKRVTIIDGMWQRQEFVYDENGLIHIVKFQNKSDFNRLFGDESEYKVSYTFYNPN